MKRCLLSSADCISQPVYPLSRLHLHCIICCIQLQPCALANCKAAAGWYCKIGFIQKVLLFLSGCILACRAFAVMAEQAAGDTQSKMKRLSREMRNLHGKTSLPVHMASSVFVRHDSDRMDKVRAMITGT